MGFFINIDKKARSHFEKLGFIINEGEYYIGAQLHIELPSYGSVDLAMPFKLGAFSYVDSKSIGNIEIGRYCSIATDINISPYQHHPTNWLSTSPFQYKSNIFNWNKYYTENLIETLEYEKYPPKSYIGNDVWIGAGVFIKNGIKIGDGAIIGAGSVVTKDVEPFSIVAGNPAKLIRYRFSDDIIEKINKLQWWNFAFPDFGNIDYSDPAKAVEQIEEAINGYNILPYQPKILTQKDFEPFIKKEKKALFSRKRLLSFIKKNKYIGK